jgi:signal transduction histidine kinase
LAELGGAPYPAASPSGPPVGRRCYCAPLIESGNHVIGVAAFDHPGADHLDAQSVQALIMLLSLTAVSLVNARSFEELKRAHDELDGLNRAKTKMIEHLSHELKTPLAVIGASAALLKKDRVQSDPRRRNAALDRIQRGLDRLADMEAQTADIASGRAVQAPDRDRGRLERDLVLALLRQDPELQQAADRVEQRLEDLFDPPDQRPETIELAPFVSDLVDRLRPRFTHRRLTVTTDARADGRVFMPRHVLTKSVTGLIKNAVEATPDGGRVTVTVDRDQNAPRIEVTDTGVGLDPELRRHLFFGFVHSGSTADYSSKRPWDFGAGGQGLDLLRIKLFGRRWGFEIEYDSRSPRDPTGRSGARFALIFEPSPPARETT